jgi:hypothetical protein
MSKRIELGCAGHFIAASSCRFHRHTQVGDFRVSTVGDYYPLDGRKRTPLGADPASFFETMVFRTVKAANAGNEGCGCREVLDWSELDSKRYATAGEAQAGHERMVAKYLRRRPVSSTGPGSKK